MARRLLLYIHVDMHDRYVAVSNQAIFRLFGFNLISLCSPTRFKTLHDSTFEATDFVHKVVDVFYIASVASAAIFIQPLKVRSLKNLTLRS